MKVLIADDEATSRVLLEETLQEWGYETCTASDGLQARRIMDLDNAPSMAILDWMMPGMDGPELCRKLRESQKSQYMYIILLTSKSEKKDVILGMDSGADAFLTKPVDIEELRSRLMAGKRILGHQSQLSAAKPEAKTSVMASSELLPVANVDAATAERYVKSAEDLTRDSLLALAPRRRFGNRIVPMLGKILVLNKIGEGGMGAVYRGYNPRLQREVAVKVLSAAHFHENSGAAARFYREAQIASMVKSDHLVSVSDVDQENGVVYLIMELIDGKTATDCLMKYMLVNGGAGLPEEIALDMCIAAAKGLAAAHAGGIVHRDVKPDNILLPYSDSRMTLEHTAAKLADLGIARQESADQALTATNASMGTAGFMAPEQILDARTAGKPADVFGLGATLYVLLCGRAPFLGTSTYDVFTATINQPHKPVQAWRPDVSTTTAAIIDACLAKRAEDRYPDASALLEDLIYCRRLLQQTRKPGSAKSSVALPRVIETPVDAVRVFENGDKLLRHEEVAVA